MLNFLATFHSPSCRTSSKAIYPVEWLKFVIVPLLKKSYPKTMLLLNIFTRWSLWSRSVYVASEEVNSMFVL